MAKKRGGGGGSNIGLIITLVFFILTTVILGVTTYMGFSQVEEAEKKKKEADSKLAERTQEVDWYKFQNYMTREFTGHSIGPGALDEAVRAKLDDDRKAYSTGALKYAEKRKDEPDFKNFIEKMQKDMPWGPNQKQPATDFERRLVAERKLYRDQLAANTQLLAQKEEAEKEEKKWKKMLDQAKKTFDDEVVALKNKADKDRENDRTEIATLRTKLDRANQDKNTESVARQKADNLVTQLDAKLKTEKGNFAVLKKEKDDITNYRDQLKNERDLLIQKYGTDPQTIAAEQLDAKSQDVLKQWKKDWKIIQMDRKGTMPYINLGSADGVKTQLTFSVHSRGLDGKMSLIPKGSVEVVQVIGPNLSRVRVNSVKNAKDDPIVKGDYLFNATWDPSRKRRVAIAGLADLGGVGVDSSADLVRLLKRQGVVIDAYIDTKNPKMPEIKDGEGGKGDITTRTDFLIVASDLETVRHDKARDKEYTDRFNKLKAQLESKAKGNGSTVVVSLERYLDMIGYNPPKISTSRDTGSNGR